MDQAVWKFEGKPKRSFYLLPSSHVDSLLVRAISPIFENIYNITGVWWVTPSIRPECTYNFYECIKEPKLIINNLILINKCRSGIRTRNSTLPYRSFRLRAHLASHPLGYQGALSPRVKRQGSETDYSPQLVPRSHKYGSIHPCPTCPNGLLLN